MTSYGAQRLLVSSDVLSARHPYGQPAFTGCRTGNKEVDRIEVSMAFGRRGVPKLAAVLALGAEATTNPETLEPSEVARVIDATDAALRALYEELARQESRSLAVSSGVIDSLRVLIARPESSLKMYCAKCLERLATMRHARVIFGHDDCAVICALVLLLSYRQGPGSGGAGTATGAHGSLVRLAATSALRMLSESRDGCALLLEAAGTISGLVHALVPPEGGAGGAAESEPILLGEALFSLGNLTKMDEAIKSAMEAGLVEACMTLLAQSGMVHHAGVQLEALVLKCVWNSANLPVAKLAIIGAEGVPKVAWCLASGDPDIRRLAVGTLLALLVEQGGKEAAVALAQEEAATRSDEGGVVESLAMLLDDESEETRINAVAAIRSMCDHPAGAKLFREHRVAVSQQWMDLFPSVYST